MLHNLYSVSKSFTSCIVGIAIDNGWIPDTNARVFPYFPEYQYLENTSLAKSSLSLRHLLTMTSGLQCNDWEPSSLGGSDKLKEQKNMLPYLLSLPMVDVPGARAQYCSGGVVLLNHLLSKATGRTYEAIAGTSLFEPLGIKKFKMNYSKNNSSDPDMVFLCPRDMAKFGMLYLNNGKWNNKQIVSSEWVRVSFESKTNLRNTDYGFLWWIHKGYINGNETKIYVASGNGGQFIFIIPSLNMVVAMTAGNIDSPYTAQGFNILYDHIIPSNR